MQESGPVGPASLLGQTIVLLDIPVRHMDKACVRDVRVGRTPCISDPRQDWRLGYDGASLIAFAGPRKADDRALAGWLVLLGRGRARALTANFLRGALLLHDVGRQAREEVPLRMGGMRWDRVWSLWWALASSQAGGSREQTKRGIIRTWSPGCLFELPFLQISGYTALAGFGGLLAREDLPLWRIRRYTA